MDYESICRDVTLYRLLTSAYASIAGYSSGYVEQKMREDNMPRIEAETKMLEIDKAARDKIYTEYKTFTQKMGDEEE